MPYVAGQSQSRHSGTRPPGKGGRRRVRTERASALAGSGRLAEAQPSTPFLSTALATTKVTKDKRAPLTVPVIKRDRAPQASQTSARPHLRLHVQLAQDGERAAARERLARGRAVRVPGRRQRRRERPLAAAVRLRAQRAASPGGAERARRSGAVGSLPALRLRWKRLRSRLGRAAQQRRHDARRRGRDRRGEQARRPVWRGQRRSPRAAHTKCSGPAGGLRRACGPARPPSAPPPSVSALSWLPSRPRAAASASAPRNVSGETCRSPSCVSMRGSSCDAARRSRPAASSAAQGGRGGSGLATSSAPRGAACAARAPCSGFRVGHRGWLPAHPAARSRLCAGERAARLRTGVRRGAARLVRRVRARVRAGRLRRRRRRRRLLRRRQRKLAQHLRDAARHDGVVQLLHGVLDGRELAGEVRQLRLLRALKVLSSGPRHGRPRAPRSAGAPWAEAAPLRNAPRHKPDGGAGVHSQVVSCLASSGPVPQGPAGNGCTSIGASHALAVAGAPASMRGSARGLAG